MNRNWYDENNISIHDVGQEPIAVDIEHLARMNTNFRTALWTGEHLQVTLMSIPVGGDIGMEMHPDVDQFIRIEYGIASVGMGNTKDRLSYQKQVNSNFALIIPAGTWHNISNIGRIPLKLYSIYAPPQHPQGTVHRIKEEEHYH